MKNLFHSFYNGKKKLSCHPDDKNYKKKISPCKDKTLRQQIDYSVYINVRIYFLKNELESVNHVRRYMKKADKNCHDYYKNRNETENKAEGAGRSAGIQIVL